MTTYYINLIIELEDSILVEVWIVYNIGISILLRSRTFEYRNGHFNFYRLLKMVLCKAHNLTWLNLKKPALINGLSI